MTEPKITIVIMDRPLPDWPTITRTDCGAVVDFQGLVRGEEGGREIAGLDYVAYREMAAKEMERIAHELLVDYPCREIYVAHRLGFVPVGEAAIALRIASPHRGEAIKFLEHFMIRLKQDVPIWKQISPSTAP